MKRAFACALLCAAGASACAAPQNVLQREDVRHFVAEMVDRHGFSAEELDKLFRHAQISDRVLKAATRPAETLPWYRYERIFLQPDRVSAGVEFWRDNADTLKRAEQAYGVPEEIIVAILGVETRYGRNIGDYRVLDSLTTLAFDFPKRGAFFRDELENYLLLTREQKLDPLNVKGSYAGAMGIPQFIASSYRRYAVDFDIDGATDIWRNPTDAIGSVANYFHEKGWLAGGMVALPTGTPSGDISPGLTDGLEPDLTAEDLASHGIEASVPPPPGQKVKLLEFETETGIEYWLGFWNFYVITRYNNSALYAMAVYQLASRIREEYSGQGASVIPATGFRLAPE